MTDPSFRLRPHELVKALHQRHQRTNSSHSVLLVLHLNRSDRIAALAQQPFAKAVLIEVARRVEAILRPDDRYAIVSADEIWVLLSGLPSTSLAEMAGRTLRESLMRPVTVNRGDANVGSVQLRPVLGGSWSPGGLVSDPMTLVNAAAEATVRARASEDHMLLEKIQPDTAVMHRDTIEKELRAALYGNELDVYFQPQIDSKTGACVAAEALIRWIRPDGKSVSPGLIASVCEERGMMAQLTHFVLNSALRHLMFWRGQDIDISVGINLSAVTLADRSFPALVEQSLRTWGIGGEHLTLELTESSIVQHEASAVEFMSNLKALGCQLAIDDFGTGHSSFSYLQQFPLDELKIDQSFVRQIAMNSGNRQIVAALINLAHTFEMHALAEGIESHEALAVLEELGCDRGQGFYYSQPIPANDFNAWFHAYQSTVVAHND